MRFSPLLLALPLAACMAPQQAAVAPPDPRLYAETFGPARGPGVRTLVVVLHDDPAPNHFAFAAAVAKAIPGSAAVALLRPGYADASGHRSPGDRGAGTGDNYTADRIAAVADALSALRARYPAAHLVVVGNSGGAAVAANVAGIRPGLIDGLVLVACPCTLPEWRKHMKKRLPSQPWDAQVASLDPLKTAGGIPATLRAAVLVGEKDPVTPAQFSRSYAQALALRGVPTDYRIVPGKGHDLLDDPEVLDATARIAGLLGKTGG